MNSAWKRVGFPEYQQQFFNLLVIHTYSFLSCPNWKQLSQLTFSYPFFLSSFFFFSSHLDISHQSCSDLPSQSSGFTFCKLLPPRKKFAFFSHTSLNCQTSGSTGEKEPWEIQPCSRALQQTGVLPWFPYWTRHCGAITPTPKIWYSLPAAVLDWLVQSSTLQSYNMWVWKPTHGELTDFKELLPASPLDSVAEFAIPCSVGGNMFKKWE